MRRWQATLAATICGGLALVDFASAGGSSTPSTPPASTGTPLRDGSSVAAGRRLFLSSCASCHGMSAQGIAGRAPSLHGVGALAADFYLETGRMPLPSTRAQPMRTHPAFSQTKIGSLVAYVASFGGPALPAVHPRRGSVSKGQGLFALDCAGCHTIQGQGGIVTGAVVPSLGQTSPRQVAEAIRIGPYVMPRFGPGEISNDEIDSISRYVQSIQSPADRGGWGIGRIGPIPEGMVAWLLAAATLVLIARLLGERIEETSREPDDGGRSSV